MDKPRKLKTKDLALLKGGFGKRHKNVNKQAKSSKWNKQTLMINSQTEDFKES